MLVLQPRRGLAYQRRIQRAIEDFNESIRFAPTFAGTFRARGKARMTIGQLEDALADFNEALRISPDYALAVYERGLAWAVKGVPESAIEDFTRTLQLVPSYAAAYHQRGCAWMAFGASDKALETLMRPCTSSPILRVPIMTVEFVGGQKRSRQGDSRFQRVLRLLPQYVGAYIHRGQGWANQGEFEKAIEDFTAAINLNPAGAAAYYARGKARGEQERAGGGHYRLERGRSLGSRGRRWLRRTRDCVGGQVRIRQGHR